MANEPDNFRACSCCDSADEENVYIQELWKNHRGSVYVIVCEVCGNFVPCGFEWHNTRGDEFLGRLKKAWLIHNQHLDLTKKVTHENQTKNEK